MKVYTQFLRPPQVVVECTAAEGKTKQSESAAVDVNRIVAQFDRTGVLPQVRPGQFLDVSAVGDYREALEEVRLAESFFSSLPAAIRTEFANDPAAFLDFAVDPANRGRMQELKLIPADVVVPAGGAGAPG